MSGITGLFYLNNKPANPHVLTSMNAQLAHRGPDGQSTWHAGEIGLGHTMLRVTPEAVSECLPLVDSYTRCVITADACLDNRADLIKTLGLTRFESQMLPDSRLILEAYHKWGSSCPTYLLGAFAFAIWDADNHHLFCARDHIGIKPFYYAYQAGQHFAFASEIKALLCVPAVPRRLNEVMVANYLASFIEDQTITFYEHIFRLPPAHSAIITPTAMQLQPYWALDPSREIKHKSDDAYAQGFRDIFTEAVRCRLRTSGPIGSSLSGGLDSSSIVCTAQMLLNQVGESPLHTFSYLYDGIPACDERHFIDAVLSEQNVIPHFLQGGQQNPLGDTDKILHYYDEAFIGPNSYLPWGLTKAARQNNIRVLLDGFDGDTVVSHGDFYLSELAYKGDWSTFTTEAEQLAQRFNSHRLHMLVTYGLPPVRAQAKQGQWPKVANAVNAIHHNFQVPRRNLWLHHGLKPLVPMGARQTWRKLRGEKTINENSDIPINALFAQRIGLYERIRQYDQATLHPPRTLREEQWQVLTAGGLAYVLELCDKTAAAFSLEARHPFMDKRLIEYCLALPAEQKLSQGWPRRILREAMRGILPEPVRLRHTKADLEEGFVRTLMTFEGKKADDLIFNKLGLIDDYIDRPLVQAAYRRLKTQKNTNSSDIFTVWKALNLTQWLAYTGLTTK
ncbi:MAG: lasso peptide isopeptide bond-forming cyclase [Anaerolineae bacterium]|nr:lasso peptide isopeptide bond-forming cyclase [Anaerolineae bacterium]